MRTFTTGGLAVIIVGAAFAGTVAQGLPAELKPGDLAPAFTLPGTDGRTYSLADYKGVKPVVVAWFPKGPIRE
jgi:hypothetical protein